MASSLGSFVLLIDVASLLGSFVPLLGEKTVNTKENKKQAKQEKRKRKDDKTDTDPQKMYRGNDQSHNADKRRNRFDREKREPEISVYIMYCSAQLNVFPLTVKSLIYH
jgi:ligand-binding sensor domain-containing protein